VSGPDPREPLGRLVRDTWVTWAREQPNPKPSWLAPWDELDDGQREVDMRIGAAVAETVVANFMANLDPAVAAEIAIREVATMAGWRLARNDSYTRGVIITAAVQTAWRVFTTGQ
jgi:hypothetical protein